MERKVTKLENSHVEVLVTVDTDSWKKAQEKAFKKVSANVKVDGFRPGKAPEAMLRKRVDNMKVIDEAINDLLPTLYKDVLDNEDVKPMAQPKVEVTKLSDTDLEVKFTIVVSPEVELGEYKGLKIGKEEPKVTAKDVNAAIEALQKQNATLVVKDGAAELGDTIVMDFVGSVDGVPFEGGAAENHELELGSGQFIPGFEDQCVGLKAGEKKDINVTFPENYTPELKGKAAVFAITCHEVKAKKIPELNDEFVKDLSIPEVNTIDELKAHKEKELLEQKKAEARRAYLGKVVAAIAEKSKISIPDEIIDEQVASRRKDIENRMKQSGLTLDQYLSILGQKEEEFMAKLKEDSKADFTRYLVVDKVGQVENIVVTDEDVDVEMAKVADQYKMKLEDVKKALANQLGEYRYNIRMNRVEDFLFENND